MMERGRTSPPPQRQHVPPGNPSKDRASSLSGGGEKVNFGGGPRSSYFGDEAEEGMIPQDEGGIYQAAVGAPCSP